MKKVETVKRTMVKQYSQFMCEDFNGMVGKCSSIEDLLAYWKENELFLRDMQVPTPEMLRDTFGTERKVLNEHSIYLDDKTIVHNPKDTHIILCGTSEVTFVLDDMRLYHIILRDGSQAKLIIRGWCVCDVVEIGESHCEVLLKNDNARLKIRKV